MSVILKNIIKVEAVSCADLAGCDIIPGRGVKLPANLLRHDMSVIGLAECTDKTAIEGKVVIHTISLSAATEAAKTLEQGSYGFILTVVGGDRYVLGSCEHPYPVYNTQVNMPGKVTTSSADEFTIEYKGTTGLRKIIG